MYTYKRARPCGPFERAGSRSQNTDQFQLTEPGILRISIEVTISMKL
jgi:hypothetical protein